MNKNRRERVLKTISHNQPDRVPIDFSGHRSSGINPEAYRNLRQYLGLPERPIKVYDMVQQLAVLDEDILVAGVVGPGEDAGDIIGQRQRLHFFFFGGKHQIFRGWNPIQQTIVTVGV